MSNRIYNIAKHELGMAYDDSLPPNQVVSWDVPTLLLMTCFRPCDIVVFPLPPDQTSREEDTLYFQIMPFVAVDQALRNLKASKAFVVETTKAGKIAKDHVNKAIREWPRFKKDYLVLNVWHDDTSVSLEKKDLATKRFQRMLSQGRGASKLLREFFQYYTDVLPPPAYTTEIFPLERLGERSDFAKRMWNRFHLHITWEEYDADCIIRGD